MRSDQEQSSITSTIATRVPAALIGKSNLEMTIEAVNGLMNKMSLLPSSSSSSLVAVTPCVTFPVQTTKQVTLSASSSFSPQCLHGCSAKQFTIGSNVRTFINEILLAMGKGEGAVTQVQIEILLRV